MFAVKGSKTWPTLLANPMNHKLLTILLWVAVSVGALCGAEGQGPDTAPATPQASRSGSAAYRETLARAEKGDRVAQFNLAMMLVAGKEVERNLTNAVTWLKKSAEGGNAAAQFNLAVFYSQGAAVPQDFTEAAR